MALPASRQALRQGALKKETTFLKQLWFFFWQRRPPFLSKHLALTNGYMRGAKDPEGKGPFRKKAGTAKMEAPKTKVLSCSGDMGATVHRPESSRTKLTRKAVIHWKGIAHVRFLSLSSGTSTQFFGCSSKRLVYSSS